MSYSQSAHRDFEHQRCLALAARGPGVHPYALDQAQRMEKEWPEIHAGLVEAVEQAIGPELPAVREALKWFARNPSNPEFQGKEQSA